MSNPTVTHHFATFAGKNVFVLNAVSASKTPGTEPKTFEYIVQVDPNDNAYGDTYAAIHGIRDDKLWLASDTGLSYNTDLKTGNLLYDAKNKRPIIRSESIDLSPPNNIGWEDIIVSPADWLADWESEITDDGEHKITLPVRIDAGGNVIRTGKAGRAVLGQFGANVAADPLVSRWQRNENGEIVFDEDGLPIFQIVLITRGNDGVKFNSLTEAAALRLLAIPGGMLELGETLSKTLRKEFGEEALDSMNMTPDEHTIMLAKLDELFKHGHTIYTGYSDDPRDTDHAWMNTLAQSFHDNTGQSVGKFKLKAGDDAADVCWFTWDRKTPMILYAKHTELVSAACALQTFLWQTQQ